MNNEQQNDPKQLDNRYRSRSRFASVVACLVIFIAIAVFVIWIEIRFLSHERPEQPAESACSTSSSCLV